MKLNAMAFANAHGLVGGAFFIICRIWAMVSPSSLSWIGNSWFHTADLTALPTKAFDITTAVGGLVTFVILAMAWGYFVAWAYNMAVKK